MSRTFRIRTQINKPVADVFAAVVSSDSLINYFADRTSGDLQEGKVIVWNWEDYGDHPVTVTKVKENELIEFVLSSLDWQKSDEDAYDVTVTMEFEAIEDNRTMLSISESGWKESADGIKGSYDNCEGWTNMVMCLKAYLEYGIDLRK